MAKGSAQIPNTLNCSNAPKYNITYTKATLKIIMANNLYLNKSPSRTSLFLPEF